MYKENARPVSSYKSQLSKEQEKANEQENELQKALALKDHYFGSKKVRIILTCLIN